MKKLATSLLGLFLLFGGWTGIQRAEAHEPDNQVSAENRQLYTGPSSFPHSLRVQPGRGPSELRAMQVKQTRPPVPIRWRRLPRPVEY